MSTDPDHLNSLKLGKVGVFINISEIFSANYMDFRKLNFSLLKRNILKLPKLDAYIIIYGNQIRLVKVFPEVIETLEYPLDSEQHVLKCEVVASSYCNSEI